LSCRGAFWAGLLISTARKRFPARRPHEIDAEEPLSRVAPFTSMPSARTKARWNCRAARCAMEEDALGLLLLAAAHDEAWLSST